MVHRWTAPEPDQDEENPSGLIVGLLLIVCLTFVILGLLLAKGSLA